MADGRHIKNRLLATSPQRIINWPISYKFRTVY